MDLLLRALPAPSYSLKPPQHPHHQQPQQPHQRKSHRRRRRRQSVSVDASHLIDRRRHPGSDETDAASFDPEPVRRLSDAGDHQPSIRQQQRQNQHLNLQQPPPHQAKGRTVYYSLRQTDSLVDCGAAVPGAPPATPLPVENPGLKYVLSLQDTRSKRELSLRLTEIREKRKDIAKQSDMKAQLEEREREEARVAQRRIEQRNRIYALNKLMTELELADFQTFRASRGAT